jgi:glycosyltransferase involved in cell wall biosynthesis
VGGVPAAAAIVTVTVFVLPGDVADTTVPSGGNVFDLRMVQALSPEVRAVHGTWPEPDDTSRTELATTLRNIPDGAVVLLDGLVACGVPSVVAPEARRLRLVVLVHMLLADETGRDPTLAADLDAREAQTLRAANAVVTTSPWQARRLVRHHGLPAERVHAVVPGVDSAPLATGTGGRLLCVASVTPHKGQDVLASALGQVTDLPWTCLCVGSLTRAPDFVTEVRDQIARLGLTDRMVLTGPKPDMNASYAEADLLVLPSRGETYGMVITEALARGVPVAVTAAQAAPETLGQAPDGSVPGMLITPGDPADLASAVRRFLTEPDFRQRLRTAALDRRTTLTSWDETARQLATILDQVATGAVCAA